MYAIISDIHSNLTALKAVLADIDSQEIKRVLCLGDVVSYGPDPADCLTLVRKHCEFMLKGNHDVAVVFEPLGFNQVARKAALWTKETVRPGLFSFSSAKANWNMLKNAPDRYEEGHCLFVHASPRDPVMEYIEESDVSDPTFGPSKKIIAIMEMLKGVCFVGHTHRPGVITEDFRFIKPHEIDMRWVCDGKKAVINVGSVGQPRDLNPKACYVTVNGNEVKYHRVPYDIEQTANRIRSIPELHDHLADRLFEGR